LNFVKNLLDITFEDIKKLQLGHQEITIKALKKN
jgi:hypothetical protein